MGALIGLLFLIGCAVLWCFFAFVPPWVNERALSIFNWSVIAACVMICASWVMYMDVLVAASGQGSDEKFRWPLAAVGALLIEICFLALMFLLRNFWVFKPPRMRSRW